MFAGLMNGIDKFELYFANIDQIPIPQSATTDRFGVDQNAVLAAKIFDDGAVGIRQNLGMITADEVVAEPYIVSLASSNSHRAGLDAVFLVLLIIERDDHADSLINSGRALVS
jgi:hypothetical protein